MIVRYLILGLALCSTGCSSLIATRGLNLYEVNTKEKVHEHFGKPRKTGIKDGKPFEEYVSRYHVYQPELAMNYLIGSSLSMGILEFVHFPCEVARVTGNTLLGRTFRVCYLNETQVEGISVREGIYYCGTFGQRFHPTSPHSAREFFE